MPYVFQTPLQCFVIKRIVECLCHIIAQNKRKRGVRQFSGVTGTLFRKETTDLPFFAIHRMEVHEKKWRCARQDNLHR